MLIDSFLVAEKIVKQKESSGFFTETMELLIFVFLFFLKFTI